MGRLGDGWLRLVARVKARFGSARALARELRRKNLTYVGRGKLRRLAEAAHLVTGAKVPGDWIEAGVALGGTAIYFAHLKPAAATLALYDVFSMIPPPGPSDGPDAHARYAVIRKGDAKGLGGKTYYGYQEDLQTVVADNIRAFGIDLEAARIEFHKGLFEDILHPRGPIAFAHVDCDWFDPVATCIERIFPRLSVGGVMVFDDYNAYEGCRTAVDTFLAGRRDVEVLFSDRSLGFRRLSAG